MNGQAPGLGGTETFQSDPRWRDYILFYEYFHGDNGAGLGASHQTGWTGVVAKLIELFACWMRKGRWRSARLLPSAQARQETFEGRRCNAAFYRLRLMVWGTLSAVTPYMVRNWL